MPADRIDDVLIVTDTLFAAIIESGPREVQFRLGAAEHATRIELEDDLPEGHRRRRRQPFPLPGIATVHPHGRGCPTPRRPALIFAEVPLPYRRPHKQASIWSTPVERFGSLARANC
jgi:hypothetical protein